MLGAAARRRVGRRAAARGGGDRDRARRARRGARAPAARAGRAARAGAALRADARARRGGRVRARHGGRRGAGAGPRRAHRPGGARPRRRSCSPARCCSWRTRARRWASSTPRRAELPAEQEDLRPGAARDPDRRRVLRRRRPGEPRRARGLAARAARPGAGREDADGDHVAGGRRPERRRARGRRRWPPSRSTATRCRPSTAAPSRSLPATVLAMAEPGCGRAASGGGSARSRAGADRCWTRSAPTSGAAWRASGPATCAWAIERLERAMEGEALFGSAGNAHMAYSSAFLALRLARARRSRARPGRRCGAPATARAVRRRALLDDQPRRAAAGGRLNTDEVRTIADALAATRPPDTHPLWSPWRCLQARAAAGEGDRETASRLAGEELALARRSGAPWVVGRSLRVLGELTGDAAALREAVALLDGTSARLERAKAHAALGDTATALELAERCGADGPGRPAALSCRRVIIAAASFAREALPQCCRVSAVTVELRGKVDRAGAVSRVQDAGRCRARSPPGSDGLLGVALARAQDHGERDEHLVRRHRRPACRPQQALERVADTERQAARAGVDDLERERAARGARWSRPSGARRGRQSGAAGLGRLGPAGAAPEETGVSGAATAMSRSRLPTRSE